MERGVDVTTLRNFLYLDTDTVSSYLSMLEGYVETEVDETESKEGRISAEGGIPILKGGGETRTAPSRSRKLAVTNEALFQRLYGLLDSQDIAGIPHITSVDDGSWMALRGNVVELQARLRLPTVFQAMNAVEAIKPFMELSQLFGEDLQLDTDTNHAMQGVLAVGEATKEKPVPVFLQPIYARRDAFFGNLSRRYLRCAVADLIGEVTVLAKITRIVPKGASEEVFTLLPEMQNLLDVNRTARRRARSRKNDVTEVLKGPAAMLHVVAVYQ